MFTSWFHYPITRPYPFRWFTPVVIVGGIVFTVFFSILNFGSYGFQLRTIYTGDPNTTVEEAQSKWYFRSPFNWGDQIRISCEAASLPVGSSFLTSNLGLRYELTGVSGDVTGSAPYLNNTLEDCVIDRIEIYLHKADLSTPPGNWPSWDDSSSSATGHCNISNNDNGVPTQLTFTTTLTNTGLLDWVVNSDPISHASLWWGSRLLNMYYYGTLQTMARVEGNPNPFMKGLLSYWPQSIDSNADETFQLIYYVLVENGVVINSGGGAQTFDQLRDNYFQSPMMEGLQFAKMMRALVEVDFGINHPTNPLLNDALLQEAIASVGDPNREAGGVLNDTGKPEYLNGLNWPGTIPDASNLTWINETYSLFAPVMGKLGTKNATIITQYACNVPEAKSTGTLLLAILLANIVFLQALWKILNVVAEAMVEKKDIHGDWCAGCLKAISGSSVGNDEGNDDDTAKLMAPDLERHDGEVIRMREFT